jgi:hypothetical protein
MDKRWATLRRLTLEAIDRNDALGLAGATAQSIARVASSPYYGNDKVRSFQGWIDEALNQVVYGGGTWMRPFVEEAAQRAVRRAAVLTNSEEKQVEPGRLTILQSMFGAELQGVMEAVSQRAVRAFAAGVLARQRPSQVARAAAAVVNSIGKVRGRMLAEHAVVKTFASVTLDAFRQSGIRRVGTTPERLRVRAGAHGKALVRDAPRNVPQPRAGGTGRFRAFAKKPTAREIARAERAERRLAPLGEVDVLTAGDDLVCPTCEEISLEGPYDIDTAQGLLPAHNFCRCAFIPVADERFATGAEEE